MHDVTRQWGDDIVWYCVMLYHVVARAENAIAGAGQ